MDFTRGNTGSPGIFHNFETRAEIQSSLAQRRSLDFHPNWFASKRKVNMTQSI